MFTNKESEEKLGNCKMKKVEGTMYLNLGCNNENKEEKWKERTWLWLWEKNILAEMVC